MDQQKNGLKSANPLIGLPGAVFENAWQLRWGLKLLCACLFMDAMTAYGLHQTLRGFSAEMSMVWNNLGAIVEAVALFCLIVSFVVPVTAALTRLAGVFLPWHLLNSPNYDLLHGYVTLSDLRDHCLRTGNEFAWKLFKESESTYAQWEETRNQAGVLVFGLAALFLANTVVGSYLNVSTLGVEFTSLTGGIGCSMLVAVVVAILHWAWWETSPIKQVYYPPLADDIKAKRTPLG